MAKLDPGVLITGLLAPEQSRPAYMLSAIGVVVKRAPWWSRKPILITKMPYTNINPHTGQMEIRVELGKAARSAKGKTLPEVWETVRRALKGKKMPDRLPLDMYPSKMRRTWHTLEELEQKLQRYRGATGGATTGGAGPRRIF